jgi:hypothetical protein
MHKETPLGNFMDTIVMSPLASTLVPTTNQAVSCNQMQEKSEAPSKHTIKHPL